jgi:AraC-like DNA-binding protein
MRRHPHRPQLINEVLGIEALVAAKRDPDRTVGARLDHVKPRHPLGMAVGLTQAALESPPPERDRPDELRDLPVVKGRGAVGLAFPFRKIVLSGTGLDFRKRAEPAPRDAQASGTAADLLNCVSSYLVSNAPGASADRLAAAFGMSERTYRRNLASLGTSHRQLLENARLEKTFQMLSDQSVRITEIAYETGYSDPDHFIRFFKRRVGLPPNEYRRINALF